MTSNVDFHMVWTQVGQLSILGSFQGRGGVKELPPPLCPVGASWMGGQFRPYQVIWSCLIGEMSKISALKSLVGGWVADLIIVSLQVPAFEIMTLKLQCWVCCGLEPWHWPWPRHDLALDLTLSRTWTWSLTICFDFDYVNWILVKE